MKKNEEIWALIDTKIVNTGHNHYIVRNYYISNFGRCKINDKIKTFKPDIRGYYTFNGNRLHVLIAKTFIDNPKNKPCVDHIDGNIHNNRADNLRWATYSENTNNPITKANYIETINKKEYREYLSNRTKQQWKDKHDEMVKATHNKKWRENCYKATQKQEYKDNMSKKLKGRQSPTKGKHRITYIDENQHVKYKFI